MKTVLVDTYILIDFLRGKEKARAFLIAAAADADIACSAITVAEIHAGMKDQERKLTEELIDSLTVLDVTRDIAEKAGAYRRTIRSHTLELDDCLIAATAHLKRATLATGNAKHYPMGDIEKKSVAI